MATIQDIIEGANLAPSILAKLNYRSDIVTANGSRWAVAAIRNITDNYPFEELCETNPVFVPLTMGQAQYDISYFTPNSRDVTRIDSFILQLDASSGTSIQLKYRAIGVVNPLSNTSGMPVMYTIYGSQSQSPGRKQVLIAFNPNKVWNVQARPQYKHLFTDGLADVIMVPDSWLEVVATAAALIGAQENRMSDTASLLYTMLYGNPMKKEPGMIKELVSSRAQFSNVNERQLNFIAGDR